LWDNERTGGLELRSRRATGLGVHACLFLIACMLFTSFSPLADPGGGPGPSTSSRQVSGGAPDLVVSNISVAVEGPMDGATVGVFAKVDNNGTATAREFFIAMFVAGAQVSIAEVTELAAGNSTTIEAMTKVSAGYMEIKAVADFYGSVPELSKANNILVRTIRVPAPDLTVTDLSFIPANFTDGDKVTATATVKNIGADTITPFSCSLTVDEAVLRTKLFMSLRAGDSVIMVGEWTAVAGQHDLIARADIERSLRETNESNNVRIMPLSSGYPDLRIENITTQPRAGKFIDGDPVVVKARVRNAGHVTHNGFQVRLLVDGVPRDAVDVSGLEGNGTRDVAFLWTALGGQHELRVDVDPDGFVTESNEGNNFMLLGEELPLPDLSVEKLTLAPLMPADGSLLTASALVRNRGPGATNRSISLQFTSNGDQIGGGTIEKGLAVNATVYLNVSIKASAGRNFVTVRVNPGNIIPEANLSNDAAMQVLDVLYPDLALTNLTVSPNATSLVDGGSGAVKVTVRNRGPGNTTTTFRVAFMLDGRALGSVQVDGLPTGVPKLLSLDFAPVGGPHYISARVDPDDQVHEADETNNMALLPISVGMPEVQVADLFWTPSNPLVGQAVTLTAVLRNVGRPTMRDIFVDFLANGTPVAYATVHGPALVGNVNVRVFYTVVGGEGTIEAFVDRAMHVPDANRTNDHLKRTFPDGSLVANPPGPDLAITNLSWLPTRPADGEEVSFIVTLRNAGAVPDPGPDGSKALRPVVSLLVDNARVSENSIKMLSTDGVVVVSWIAEAGTHKVVAVVDWDMLVDEGNETNNAAEMDLSVGAADITLSDLKIMTEGAQDGNTISMFVKVGNIANRTMREVQVHFFVDGRSSGYEAVEGASLNGSTTVLHRWTATPGPHTVLVIADMQRLIRETNERNNILSGGLSIKVPDLALASLQAQAQVDDGTQATVTARVRNVGQGGTLRPFTLNIYLDGSPLGSQTIAGLPSGADAVVSMSISPVPGKHFVRAVVDQDGAVSELTMANNVMSRPGLNVTYSDLKVVSVTFGPPDGRTTFVQATITNRGNTTTRPVNVGFFLDGVRVSTGTLDGLSGGYNTTIVNEMALGPGSRRLKVVVDAEGALAESDESNNQLVMGTPFRPYPNLYIDEMDVGGPMVLGGELRITAELKALGADVRTPFFVNLYIDGSLAGTTRLGGIPRGEVASVQFMATAAVGQHHVRVQVDQDNAVAESNEMDNAQVTTYTVLAPDLQVIEIRSFTAPDGIAVFARVRNNASHLLSGFLVSFYADGKLAGRASVPGLPSRTSTQVMLMVPSGTGNVRVVADNEGAVPETDESNNGLSAHLVSDTVGGALDLTVSDIFWVPQSPVDGETATFFAIVENVGNMTMLGGAVVDLRVDNVSVGQSSVSGLPEGGASVIPFQWIVKAGQDMNITVSVSAGGAVPDAVGSNNNQSVWLNVSAPALKILNVSYPTGYFGEERTLFVRVGNIGAGDTLRRFSAAVSVEGALVASEALSGLPAGANTTVAMEVTHGWGQKELLVELGPEAGGKAAGGSSTKLTNISLGWPDLQVTKLWAEKRANASMTTAFAQVRNAGYGIGSSFSVRMFVNGKDRGPSTVGGLQGNGTVVLAWAFPSTDIAVLAALADDGNAIPESNELNNYLDRNLTGNDSYIPPDIDLALTSLNITQYGEPQYEFVLDALVENTGINVSGFKVKFLVDGKVLTEVPVGPMKANSSRTVTVHYDGRAEDHIFKIIVDSARAIAELDETDNELRVPYRANFPPIPYPGNDQTITQGGKAKLFARGWDPDGTIVRYEWDFDGDGKFEWSSNQSVTVYHTYKSLPKHGAPYYNATLRVTDDRGAVSTAMVKIKVVEKKPWPSIPAPDRTRVIALVLGLICIVAGLVILYLFIRASRPMRVTKAELERRKRLEKEGVRRFWPPWKQEAKDEVEDEREAEPEVVPEAAEAKPGGYPEYPEDAPAATIQELPPPEDSDGKES